MPKTHRALSEPLCCRMRPARRGYASGKVSQRLRAVRRINTVIGVQTCKRGLSAGQRSQPPPQDQPAHEVAEASVGLFWSDAGSSEADRPQSFQDASVAHSAAHTSDRAGSRPDRHQLCIQRMIPVIQLQHSSEGLVAEGHGQPEQCPA